MEVTGAAASCLNSLRLPTVYGFVRRKVARSQVAILAYHHVGPQRDIWAGQTASMREFEKQMKHLRRTCEILSLDRLEAHIRDGVPLPEKAVVITIDDGYRDNYIYAYAILKRYAIPATIFLATGHVGNAKPFKWDEVTWAFRNTRLEAVEIAGLGRYSLRTVRQRVRAARRVWNDLCTLPETDRISRISQLLEALKVDVPTELGSDSVLSWDEVREMSRAGIAFGAHTVNHPILTCVPLAAARNEIVQSKRDIEAKLDKAVTAFCYPAGRFNGELAGIVRESGFTCAVTGDIRMISPGESPYELPRIPPGWNLGTLNSCLSGLYPDWLAVCGAMTGRQGTLRRRDASRPGVDGAGENIAKEPCAVSVCQRETGEATRASFETSRDYWEETWQDIRLGRYRNIERYLAINRKIDWLYKRFLKKGNKRFIEIGCARGKELIYFAREFGYEPYGVDYSEKGAALARKNLELAGVRGTVLCEDIFETSLPPESFDIVYSAGLVEHFDNPDAIADAHVRLLKKGGTLIIIVPNFRDSLYSALMKTSGKKTLLAMHNTGVMSKEFLHGLAEEKGIRILSLDYFGPIDLTSAFGTIKLTPLLWLAHLLNQVVGYATFWMPRSHYFSPCLVLIGQKTEGESRQG